MDIKDFFDIRTAYEVLAEAKVNALSVFMLLGETLRVSDQAGMLIEKEFINSFLASGGLVSFKKIENLFKKGIFIPLNFANNVCRSLKGVPQIYVDICTSMPLGTPAQVSYSEILNNEDCNVQAMELIKYAESKGIFKRTERSNLFLMDTLLAALKENRHFAFAVYRHDEQIILFEVLRLAQLRRLAESGNPGDVPLSAPRPEFVCGVSPSTIEEIKAMYKIIAPELIPYMKKKHKE